MRGARVYLGGLSDKVSVDDLHKYLSVYGRISEVKLRPGFGFVQFESDKDARDVVHTFSTRQFLGQDVSVQLARPDRHNRKEVALTATRSKEERASPSDSSKKMKYSVSVKGLNPRTCWQELKDFGRLLGGDVAFCDIDRDKRTHGFLNYSREEDADRAVRELDGQELLGHVVRLKRHVPKGTWRWERPRNHDRRSCSPSRRGADQSTQWSREPRLQRHKPSRSGGDWKDRLHCRSYDENGDHGRDSHLHGDYGLDTYDHTAGPPPSWTDYRGHDDHHCGPYDDRVRIDEHSASLISPGREPETNVPPLLPRPEPATPFLIPRDPPSPITPFFIPELESYTPLLVPKAELTTASSLAGPVPATHRSSLEVNLGSPVLPKPEPVTLASVPLLPRCKLRPLPPLPPKPVLSTSTTSSD